MKFYRIVLAVLCFAAIICCILLAKPYAMNFGSKRTTNDRNSTFTKAVNESKEQNQNQDQDQESDTRIPIPSLRGGSKPSRNVYDEPLFPVEGTYDRPF